MILLLLLVSTTITAGLPPNNAPRRLRQLDLGPQTDSNEKISTANAVTNGYLPPVSASTIQQKVVGAQSQQTVDVLPTNQVKNELCTDSVSCGFKESSSKSDSDFPLPSRDLVPPFDEVEPKTETVVKQQSEITKGTSVVPNTQTFPAVVSQSTFATTTRKPITKTAKPQKTNEKLALNKAEATNELRSYLPPQSEFSAAAQTAVEVVKPAEENHHHHDHHHHHGDNVDICSDAFHSFLCAPLKARKRITGALPNSLRGQSSFVQYQKVLPEVEKEPAPSNAFRNEYLPPRPSPSSPSASNIIQSTYSPPQTTRRPTTTTTTPKPYYPPKIIQEPSNANDRFYLPPLPNNRIAPVRPDFSNQVESKVKPSPSTQAPSTFAVPVIRHQTQHVSTFSPIVLSVTTAKPTSIVPVITTSRTIPPQKILPSSSFQKEFSKMPSTALPTVSTFTSQAPIKNPIFLAPIHHPKPDVSFFSTTKKFYPTTTIAPLPSSYPTVPTFVPLLSNSIHITPAEKFQTFPKIVSTTKQPFTTTVNFAPQPANTVVFDVKPSFPSKSSFVPLSSKPKDLPPQPKFQSASNLISTTIKPFTTTRKPSPSFFGNSEQASATDRSYLPPDPNVQPAAAQINAEAVAPPRVKNPFHHGRDLCTDPFHSFLCASAKPRKRITGALPSGFKPDSSNTNESRVKPAASFQNENRIKTEKPLKASPTQGYNYIQPINPLPAQSKPIPTSTAPPTTGYSYSKPEKIFPLPSQQKEVVSTAKPVTTKAPAPVVLRTSEARTVTGYDYPKPEKPFPPPSEIPKTPTTPKPSTSGYSYPKPQKPFPLPTEQKEVRYSGPKTLSPSSTSLSPSTNVPQGYQYNKPQQSFELPEKKGYSYPKPEKQLELPTENRSKSLLSQTNSNINILGNLGSAEFIPVNKLEKRDDSSAGHQRFGERLKKRERRYFV